MALGLGLYPGGTIAGTWPYINQLFGINVPSMLPGFISSFLLILIVSKLTQPKNVSVAEE